MRVLLISANTEKINMPTLPLGLACVAAATQKAGHEVAIVDLMTEKDAQSVLKGAITRPHWMIPELKYQILMIGLLRRTGTHS